MRRWNYELTVLVLMWFGVGIVAFDRTVILSLFPLIVPEFQLSFFQVGLIVGMTGIGWAIVGTIGGGLSDSLGRKSVAVATTLIFSLLSVVTGFANNFASLIGIRTVMGAVEGSFWPAAVASMAEEAAPQRRGFMVGAVQSAFPLWSSFIAAIVGTQLAAAFHDWRPVFFVTIVPGFILLACLIVFLRQGRPGGIPSTEARPQSAAPATEPVRRRDMFRYPNVLLLTFICICYMLWVWILLAYSSLFFTQAAKLSLTTAGLVVSMFGLGAFVGMFAIPAVSDRSGRRPVAIAGSLAAGVLTALTIWLASSGSGNVPALMAALFFVNGFLGWGCFPIYLAIVPVESTPPAMHGLAVGVITGVSEVVGALVVIFGGALADAYGLPSVFYLAAAGIFVAGLISLGLTETAPVRVGVTGLVTSPAVA